MSCSTEWESFPCTWLIEESIQRDVVIERAKGSRKLPAEVADAAPESRELRSPYLNLHSGRGGGFTTRPGPNVGVLRYPRRGVRDLPSGAGGRSTLGSGVATSSLSRRPAKKRAVIMIRLQVSVPVKNSKELPRQNIWNRAPYTSPLPIV